MHTVGRTYLLTVGSGGSVVVPQTPNRMTLRIGPAVAEAWNLAAFSNPDTTHGITYAAGNPVAYMCRDYDGSAIDGQHTIYGTAGHIFVVTETTVAP